MNVDELADAIALSVGDWAPDDMAYELAAQALDGTCNIRWINDLLTQVLCSCDDCGVATTRPS